MLCFSLCYLYMYCSVFSVLSCVCQLLLKNCIFHDDETGDVTLLFFERVYVVIRSERRLFTGLLFTVHCYLGCLY